MMNPRPAALVTGGARSIGRAIALELSCDYNVALTYNTSSPDTELSGCFCIASELTQTGAPEQLIEKVINQFGTLDVIVNNAGVLELSPVDAFNAKAYSANMDLNELAPHAVLAAALPYLKPGAAIVNISSVNAEFPPTGAVMYGASKAALNLWTKGVAKELGARGIRVNAVSPGPVNIPEAPRDPGLTRQFLDLTALEKLATPQDIALAVRFLASDAARSITGEVLSVSGGYRL